jgi:hypothetical protein
MKKSKPKRAFLEFVAYLEKMVIIHDEHQHVLDHKKSGDSCTKHTGKYSDTDGRSSGHNPRGSTSGSGSNKTSDRVRTKLGNRRSKEIYI